MAIISMALTTITITTTTTIITTTTTTTNTKNTITVTIRTPVSGGGVAWKGGRGGDGDGRGWWQWWWWCAPSLECVWAVRRGRESINMVSVVGGVVTFRHAWPRPADPDKCLISTQTTVNREPICAVVGPYRGALLLFAARRGDADKT